MQDVWGKIQNRYYEGKELYGKATDLLHGAEPQRKPVSYKNKVQRHPLRGNHGPKRGAYGSSEFRRRCHFRDQEHRSAETIAKEKTQMEEAIALSLKDAKGSSAAVTTKQHSPLDSTMYDPSKSQKLSGNVISQGRPPHPPIRPARMTQSRRPGFVVEPLPAQPLYLCSPELRSKLLEDLQKIRQQLRDIEPSPSPTPLQKATVNSLYDELKIIKGVRASCRRWIDEVNRIREQTPAAHRWPDDLKETVRRAERTLADGTKIVNDVQSELRKHKPGFPAAGM